jgi:DNA damage-binding protein 1
VLSACLVCTSRIEQTPRGEESIERVLFLDQSTLSIEASYDLEMCESGMSICSCFFGDSAQSSELKEYLVVGTAFVLPEEQQPSRGRLLVFEVLSDSPAGGRMVRLVVETPTRGAVFSLASLNGKLVAGIDSKVTLHSDFSLISSQIQIYRFALSGEDGSSSPEMVPECGHHGHILALYLKASDDLILVGDLVRSICILRYRERDCLIEELARDFNSNLMRSVEIWNESHFIGAEDHGNLFVMRTPRETKTEEERSRLEVLSGFHLGDFINVIAKGSLSRTVALENPSEASEIKGDPKAALDSLLFGTVSGRLCSMFPLSAEDFNFLSVLEKSLLQVVKALSVGGLSHEEWRSFFHERRGKHQGYERKTIDGDLIERFLDLREPVMEQVTKYVNDELLYQSRQSGEEASEENKGAAPFVPISVRDLVQRVEDLTRMH